MSRKDYVAVAGLLVSARRDADADVEHGYARHVTLDAITYDLAHVFHMDNARFDSARFFSAADMRDVQVRS